MRITLNTFAEGKFRGQILPQSTSRYEQEKIKTSAPLEVCSWKEIPRARFSWDETHASEGLAVSRAHQLLPSRGSDDVY